MGKPASVPNPSVTFRADGNVAIHVPDLDRAEAFYAGVLGFRVVSRTADHLELDAGALRLYVNRDAVALRPFIPALEVPDYRAAKLRLERAGCRIVVEWPGGKALYFEDPFGLVLDIIERRPANAPARAPKT
ncbi:MAG: VOC family protein [Thermoanaerobaculales bacterium]